MLPFIGPEFVAALLHRCDESEEAATLSTVEAHTVMNPQPERNLLACLLRTIYLAILKEKFND
jgi:hypothetical protein